MLHSTPSRRDMLLRCGAGFGSLALADLLASTLAPIRNEIVRLRAEPAYIDGVLADGAHKARAIARPNMDAVKDIVGLIR